MNQVLEDSPIFSPLSESIPLRRYGYQVLGDREPGSKAAFDDLKLGFERTLKTRLEEYSGKPFRHFRLEQYHSEIAREGVEHHSFIGATKRKLPAEMAGHPYLEKLVELSGFHVAKKLRIYNGSVEYRVVRPGQSDNNPWHRDHWFPYFIPLLNVYLPLSGSFCDSALQVVPFSHLWTDEECVPTFRYGEGKTKKGEVLYSVPEIKECRFPLVGQRPDIVPGDFMLFSPRMVHGEGTNSCPETRFSLEIRLEVAV